MALNFAFLKKIILTLPEAVELPHFDKPAFRVGKKIFATVNIKKNNACLLLSPAEQELLSIFDKSVIYPAPNKSGEDGWTYFNLKKVNKDVLTNAILTAYCEVAPAKLARQVKTQYNLP